MSIQSKNKLVTISTLRKLKKNSEKFSCLTAYESTLAQRISEAGVEVILVGDSLGMVIQGHDSTLPVTMDCVEKNLGVDKEISSFVLPIGATINMDGTSVYQAVAAVFIAQAFGLDLSLGAQLGIIVTASLASIGAAAVPSAGIVMLVIVLGQAGIPEAGLALIIAVDRPLDMCRTIVNVTGDAAVSMIVAKSVGKLKDPNDVNKN